jgi:hypothetical protein
MRVPIGISSLGFWVGNRYKETMRQRVSLVFGPALGVLLALGSGVGVADTPAAPLSAVSASTPPDLRAPPITHVLTASEIETLTVDRDGDLPDVDVETTRYGVAVPVGFFRALPWAVMHPTQAWRVFTPVTEP